MAALYQLAWEDTFGGTALDRAKLSYPLIEPIMTPLTKYF